MSSVPQLPLGVQLHQSVSFATFCIGPNTAAVEQMRRLSTDRGRLYLHGANGSGKTHLLHALTLNATEQGRRAVYLDLAARDAVPLDGLERQDVIALDNLHVIFGDRARSLAVLRLLDAMQAGAVAMTAAVAPSAVNDALPDLVTRLSASAVFGLKAPSDDDRCDYLRRRAAACGLDMSEAVAQLLVSRLPRELGRLQLVVERLDRAALAAQRKLTLPFVRESLGL